MDFENKIPIWKNEGTEPTEKLETGFVAKYKPPAAYFNWFWSKVTKCINEIQTKFNQMAKTDLSNVSNKVVREKSGIIVNATYSGSSTYTATIEGITELYQGLEIIIIPDKDANTSQPKLTVNDLGTHLITRTTSISSRPLEELSTNRYGALNKGVPTKLMFKQTYWVIEDMVQPHGDDLAYQVLPRKGGTGLTEIAENNFIVGNSALSMKQKTPKEVAEMIAPHLPTATYVSYTLLASKWTGDTAPYTYLIDNEEYVGKEVNVYEDGALATAEQLDVLASANIKGSPTSAENILYAFGEKPTIDIPIALGVK